MHWPNCLRCSLDAWFSPASCLPDLLPPLLHHVCMVLLEDHLHQACQPLQRGIITQFTTIVLLSLSLPVSAISLFQWSNCNLYFLKKMCAAPLPSSFAYQRLRRRVMKRRRGQSPSRRSCGELPPICLCIPAQAPEVLLHSHMSVRINVSVLKSFPFWQDHCVTMMQQSDTVTAVKLSSRTAVITAPRVTCKRLNTDWENFSSFFFSLYLAEIVYNSVEFCLHKSCFCSSFLLFAVYGRCVLKMDHHCPWYVRPASRLYIS